MRVRRNEFFMIDEYGQFRNQDNLFISDEKTDELIEKLKEYRKLQGKEEANAEILKERRLEAEAKMRYVSEKKKTTEKGYIYFIKSESGGVKIGKTSNMKTRIKALQTASPYKLELLFSVKVDNYGAYESYVHNHFKDKHMEGEWYDLTVEEIEKFLTAEGLLVNE